MPTLTQFQASFKSLESIFYMQTLCNSCITIIPIIYNNSCIQCVCCSGLFCEFAPPMVLPRTSPCDNHECLNGAQCVVMGTDPRCQCLHGYEGERCETLVSVNFVNRESYLQLPSSLLSPETNISLQVRAGCLTALSMVSVQTYFSFRS